MEPKYKKIYESGLKQRMDQNLKKESENINSSWEK